MINVLITGRREGQSEWRAGETCIIHFRDIPASLAPSIDVLQLDAQHGRVNVVQTAVVADAVIRTLQRAVVAQLANPSGQVTIVGGNRATIAEAPQVLLDDETQADCVAEFADRETVTARADGLGAIFDDKKVMSPGDFPNRRHVRAKAIEMDRNDGARLGSNRSLNFSHID